MEFTHVFDCILYGKDTYKLAKLSIPDNCISIQDKHGVYTWKFDSGAYSVKKIAKDGNITIKVDDVYKVTDVQQNNQKYRKVELDLDNENVSNNISTLKFNDLIEYHGLVLPLDPKAPLTHYNGHKLPELEAIFTRDMRIFTVPKFKEEKLEDLIKDAIRIFSLNRYKLLFESRVRRERRTL